MCPYCRFHYTLSARERIKLISDHNSFRESHKFLSSVTPLSFSNKKQYQELLSISQTKTGLTEAVVTGRAKIEGLESMLIVLDFGFMGGSMGSVVGEKVALALEECCQKRYTYRRTSHRRRSQNSRGRYIPNANGQNRICC